MKYRGRIAASVALTAVFAASICMPAHAVDVIEDWAKVQAPAAPALKPVTIDSKTTALLLLDLINPNCPNRPRCMANIPAMKKLLTEARAKGMLVVYSVAPGKSAKDVIPDIAPQPTDPIVSANVDKFLNTDLDKILKDKGIQTVIVNGTGAHGAALYTASEAAVRGYKVVAPVDGMTSENLYFEQISVWLLANGTGGIGPKTTLTRSDMITFQ